MNRIMLLASITVLALILATPTYAQDSRAGSRAYAQAYASSSTRSFASPRTAIRNAFTVYNTDWRQASVGDIGTVGTATLNVSGVSGAVSRAYLYTHGINSATASAVYNNPTISFNGVSVTGIALGDATTNCWGPGSSRAYRFDVTAMVSGSGIYTATNLAACAGCYVNGATLVVFFSDANPNNNHDVVVADGNDSNNPEDYPGEDAGWHNTLTGINFNGGRVYGNLMVADGQKFNFNGLDDGDLTFATSTRTMVLPDALHRYDGDVVPSMGNGRTTTGSLWDFHLFELTSLFPSAGNYTLSMDGMVQTDDCTGLIALLIDLPAGAAPPFTTTPTSSPSPSPTVTPQPSLPAIICPSLPSAECRQQQAGAGRIVIRNSHGRHLGQDRFRFSSRQGAYTALTDYGDPTHHTSYALCVYDGNEMIIVQVSLDPGAHWRKQSASFVYTDFTMKQGGIRKVWLRSGLNASMRMLGGGKRNNLANIEESGNFPHLGEMPLSVPATVQLISSEGRCWESHYEQRVLLNSASEGRFIARND